MGDNKWFAMGVYKDGTVVQKYVPYRENCCYYKEQAMKTELENWLKIVHDDCVFFSVDVIPL